MSDRVTSSVTPRRIAVISSSLDPEQNELWEAARSHVGELIVLGAASSGPAELPPHYIGLGEIDAGKGLVWRHLVGLRRRLREFRPDLVHVNAELWSLTAQEVISLRAPVVVHGAENLWRHGRRLEQVARDHLVDRAVRRIAGYASWNAAGAAHVRALSHRLQPSGAAPPPTSVLPAVIPPSAFRATSWQPRSLGAGDPLEVLLVGQAVPHKGFRALIEAASRISSRRVRVTLCGDGPEAGMLTSLAAQQGVELIHHPWLRSDRLAAQMATSHVQVQPSLTTESVAEQFCRGVAEAMTVGLPCLVSTCGELPRLVGGNPHAIFAEGDVHELTVRLQAISDDRALRESLSVQQQQRAQAYSPSAAGATVADFWERVLRTRTLRSAGA